MLLVCVDGMVWGMCVLGFEGVLWIWDRMRRRGDTLLFWFWSCGGFSVRLLCVERFVLHSLELFAWT